MVSGNVSCFLMLGHTLSGLLNLPMQGLTCWKQAFVKSPRRAKELCLTSGILSWLKKKAQYSYTQPKLMKEDIRGQLQANFHCYSLKIFICFWLAQILRQNLFKTNKYYASSYGVLSVMSKKVITISILRPKTALFNSTSTCQTVPAYIGRAKSWCYFWWQTVQSVPLVLQLVHLTNLKPLSWSPCQEAQTGLDGSGMPDNKKEKEMCATGKN